MRIADTAGGKSMSGNELGGSRTNNNMVIEHIEVLETFYTDGNSDSAIGQGLSVHTTDVELSESYL